MKRILLMVMFVFFIAVGGVSAQSKATTPAANSQVRRAIIAVVKKKFGKTQKNIEKPDVLKVQDNWARIVYDLKSNGDAGSTGVNLILKKTGSVWKIVWDYNTGSEEGDDVNDYIKVVPKGISMPWDN